MKKRPALFTYLDYRTYLKDEFAWRKVSESGFSVRAFARSAGMPANSATLVSKVILGKRGLNQGMIFKFSKALGLKGEELRFFNLLVQFNQAKSVEEKNHLFMDISKFRTPRAKDLVPEQFSIYDKWYYQVLRAYFGIHQDRNNPAHIGREVLPPLSASEVDQAIKALLDSKLIRKKANGYAVSEPHIALAQGARIKRGKAHIREMTQLSLDILDQVPAPCREYSSLTMYLSEACFESIRDRMRSFREEVKVLLDRDQGEDRIYTMTMQLFPNSRLPELPEAPAQTASLTLSERE